MAWIKRFDRIVAIDEEGNIKAVGYESSDIEDVSFRIMPPGDAERYLLMNILEMKRHFDARYGVWHRFAVRAGFPEDEVEAFLSSVLFTGRYEPESYHIISYRDVSDVDLLFVTKNTMTYRPLPFTNIFIPLAISIGDSIYIGICATDHVINEYRLLLIDAVRLHDKFAVPVSVGLAMDGEKFGYSGLEGPEGTRKAKRDMKIISTILLNTVDFINTPDVKIVQSTRPRDDKKRKSKSTAYGTIPRHTIRVTGETKKYINSMKSEVQRHGYSHAFWVRGHFRYLGSEYYKSKKGETIWVHPFIKGRGVLVKREYELGDDWEK